jgi:hypothetical protein
MTNRTILILRVSDAEALEYLRMPRQVGGYLSTHVSPARIWGKGGLEGLRNMVVVLYILYIPDLLHYDS